jgi:hypothetical protein
MERTIQYHLHKSVLTTRNNGNMETKNSGKSCSKNCPRRLDTIVAIDGDHDWGRKCKVAEERASTRAGFFESKESVRRLAIANHVIRLALFSGLGPWLLGNVPSGPGWKGSSTETVQFRNQQERAVEQFVGMLSSMYNSSNNNKKQWK